MTFYHLTPNVLYEERHKDHLVEATFIGKTEEEVNEQIEHYIRRYPPMPYNSTSVKARPRDGFLGWMPHPNMPFEGYATRWASCD